MKYKGLVAIKRSASLIVINKLHASLHYTALLVCLLLYCGNFFSLQATIEILIPKIVRTIPHDPKAFTQGLALDEKTGKLYESTGLYQVSELREIKLADGKIERRSTLSPACFGEGLALLGNRLIQLTWKEEKAFYYQKEDFKPLKELAYEGEGWGLCYDSSLHQLWMSNGSSEIVRRNPDTFEIVGRLSVRLNGKPVRYLNDMVCAKGALYANVWGKNLLLRIDKQSGSVTAIIDGSRLVPPHLKSRDAVMNGIAFRERTQTFFITGKFWPVLFEVKIDE